MDLEAAWAMYFGSITAFQYHPRNEPEDRKTLAECAVIADDMLKHHKARKERGEWQSSQEP